MFDYYGKSTDDELSYFLDKVREQCKINGSPISPSLDDRQLTYIIFESYEDIVDVEIVDGHTVLPNREEIITPQVIVDEC